MQIYTHIGIHENAHVQTQTAQYLPGFLISIPWPQHAAVTLLLSGLSSALLCGFGRGYIELHAYLWQTSPSETVCFLLLTHSLSLSLRLSACLSLSPCCGHSECFILIIWFIWWKQQYTRALEKKFGFAAVLRASYREWEKRLCHLSMLSL